MRVIYWIIGIPIIPWVILYCLIAKRERFPSLFFMWDNKEDGFDGDRLGWFSGYMGFDIRSRSLLYRWFSSCWWSLKRNPVFNFRYSRWSIDATELRVDRYKGNVYHRNYKWAKAQPFTKLSYEITFTDGDKRYTSNFRAIPLWGNSYLYLRWGWKTYPEYYLDPYWLGRIERDGWPPYKDRAIKAFTIRIREYEWTMADYAADQD